jgi:hypothetical protein
MNQELRELKLDGGRKILIVQKVYLVNYPESSLEIIRITLHDQPAVDAFLKVWDEEFSG